MAADSSPRTSEARDEILRSPAIISTYLMTRSSLQTTPSRRLR